jgi:16S rRNA (guanine527-N7)-methyltransferase
VTLAREAEARQWFAAALGCDTVCLAKLERLADLLAEENKRQNLVSAASLADIWVRHFADSAQLLVVPRGTEGPWLDLGSGAGFPGLVVALCRPELSVSLAESRRKRVEWLEFAARELGLSNVRVLGSRIEALPTSAFGTITARAFAPLAEILWLARRFSTPETLWLLPKGRGGAQELQQMPKAIRRMFHVERSLTDAGAVLLVGRGVPPIWTGR